MLCVYTHNFNVYSFSKWDNYQIYKIYKAVVLLQLLLHLSGYTTGMTICMLLECSALFFN